MKPTFTGGLSLEGNAELALATEAADSTGEFLAVHEAEISPVLYDQAQARLDSLLDTLATYNRLSMMTNDSPQFINRYSLGFPASSWLLNCLELAYINHCNPAIAAATKVMLEDYESAALPAITATG